MATAKASKAFAGVPSPALPDAQKQAQTAWADGRYAELIALGATTRDGPAVMSAFALIRLNEPEAALRVLKTVQTSDAKLRARAALLGARANDIVERRDSGKTSTFLYDAGDIDAETRGLAINFSAISAYRNGRFDEALEVLESVPKDAGDWVRGSSYALQGWIEVRKARLHNAHRLFIKATKMLASSTLPDAFVHMNATFGLATTTLDSLSLDALPTLSDAIAALPSKTDFLSSKTQCLTRTSLVYQCAGRVTEGFEMLLDARAAHDPTVYAVDPFLELYEYHSRANEISSARLYRGRAKELLDHVDWGDATVDQRLFLLQLSTQFSRDDESLASKMYMRAVSTRGKVDTSLVFEHDERALAFAFYVEAHLFEARGDRERAVESWRSSLAIWAANGYRYWAAQAEVHLVRDCGVPMRTPNLEIVRRDAPKSWIAGVTTGSTADKREVATQRIPPRLSHSADVPRLGPAEQRVLWLICEGLSAPEIAHRVGRSLSTIKNQTIRIFRTYEVNDRKTLIEKARRVGALRPAGNSAVVLADDAAAGPSGNHNEPVVEAQAKRLGVKKHR